MRDFEDNLDNPLPLFGFGFRFEPGFSRAIDLAVGEGLVEWVGGDRLEITQKGTRWVNAILADLDLMSDERAFLKRIGKRLTENAAAAMLEPKGGL